jgi:hypothetical protein
MKPFSARIAVGLPALFLASLGTHGARATDMEGDASARYRVVFQRTWSEATHPQDFPLLAHFSPVIGVTHDEGFELFAAGAAPTPGIEKLCEEGKHQPLDAEIHSAMEAGHVGALIETGEPIRSAPGEGVAEFEIDAAHPRVSIAAMIAPSPDWCAVAPDVSLMQDGRFVAERSVDLYAWDAGTDGATSYRAFDADMQPRGTLQPNPSPYFTRDGAPTPVGRVTFVRM